MANQMYPYPQQQQQQQQQSSYPGTDPYLSDQARRFPDPSCGGHPPSSMYGGGYYGGMGGGLGQGAWMGGDVGAKRTNEALYYPSVLDAPNNFGHNEALFTTNTIPKRPRYDTATSLLIYPQRPGETDCAHYMQTRTCRFGESCKFDHPLWVPEGGIPDWKETPQMTLTDAKAPPERPGEPDCPYFLKTQQCRFGSRCKFNHPKSTSSPEAVGVSVLPERPSEATCTHYLKTGTCKYGAMCKFNHPKGITLPSSCQEIGNGQQEVSAPKDGGAATGGAVAVQPSASLRNSKGLPIRQGEVDCPFYIKTGSCKYGANCRFNHPDIYGINAPVGAGLPVMNFTAASMNMGVMNPVAPILQTIDSRLAQTSFGLGTLYPQTTFSQATVYPQRPGQMECDFFMKTGACKFGERCKFHHPSGPAPSVPTPTLQPTVKLTLAGLPRREDATVCAYYMKTGTCKYGVQCKFDHPPPGEAVAMATSQGKSAAGVDEGEGDAGADTDGKEE